MSPEENPPSESESDSQTSPVGDVLDSVLVPAENPEYEPVVASLVNDESIESEIVESGIEQVEKFAPTSIAYPDDNQHTTVFPSRFSLSSAPSIARNFENLAAKGGAVGAFVLGIWCFAGSFITTWSVINGLVGIGMGFWGLTSNHKKMAWIGITLCLAGMFLSLVQVSEIVNTYMNARDENPF